jgi:hypothetical protein
MLISSNSSDEIAYKGHLGAGAKGVVQAGIAPPIPASTVPAQTAAGVKTSGKQ